MADTPENTSSQAASDASGGQNQGKSSAQQRIDQLVKRSNDAERNSSQLAEENAGLTAKLASLTEKVDQLSRGTATPPTVAQTPATPPNSEQLSIDQIVAGAVTKAFNGLVEQANQRNSEQATLLRQQDSSFDRAAATFPQLRDGTSEERKLFNQLFDSRPELATSPDGPELAAEIVKGALAGSRSETRAQDQGKAQASIQRPGDLLGSLQKGPGTRQENASNALEALHKQFAAQGVDRNGLAAYIALAEETRPDDSR
jgi:hypothetical protein